MAKAGWLRKQLDRATEQTEGWVVTKREVLRQEVIERYVRRDSDTGRFVDKERDQASHVGTRNGSTRVISRKR